MTSSVGRNTVSTAVFWLDAHGHPDVLLHLVQHVLVYVHFSSVSVQGCDGHHEVQPVSIFRDSGMFTADSISSIDFCLAGD